MYCRKPGIALEIRHIECEYKGDSVDMHRRSKSRVVNLGPHDSMLHNYPAPLFINSLTVRKNVIPDSTAAT